MGVVRVAVVNDYPLVIAGLTQMLERFEERVRVVDLVVDRPPQVPVDVILYDPFAGPQPGEDVLAALLEEHSSARVIVYTWALRPELVTEALRVGFAAYVDKATSAAELAAAVERVAAGERRVVVRGAAADPVDDAARVENPGHETGGEQHPPYPRHELSSREAEVVGLITQGLTNQDITERAYLSINTVKTYIRSAYLKMGVTSRSQAVRWGMEHGLDQAEATDGDPERHEQGQGHDSRRAER